MSRRSKRNRQRQQWQNAEKPANEIAITGQSRPETNGKVADQGEAAPAVVTTPAGTLRPMVHVPLVQVLADQRLLAERVVFLEEHLRLVYGRLEVTERSLLAIGQVLQGFLKPQEMKKETPAHPGDESVRMALAQTRIGQGTPDGQNSGVGEQIFGDE